MDNKEFLELRNKLDCHCSDLLNTKKDEYSDGRNRLNQFSKAATLFDISEEQALCGMLVKHITSIFDLSRDTSAGKDIPLSRWLEKLADTRNYIDLLWAIVNDNSCELQEIPND